jgi:hypothetical protein
MSIKSDLDFFESESYRLRDLNHEIMPYVFHKEWCRVGEKITSTSNMTHWVCNCGLLDILEKFKKKDQP